jgi:hypothetical protein
MRERRQPRPAPASRKLCNGEKGADSKWRAGCSQREGPCAFSESSAMLVQDARWWRVDGTA